MTKDELKKEAEEYGIDLCAYCRECEGEKPCQHKLDAMHGYQDGLKAREKRIAELILAHKTVSEKLMTVTREKLDLQKENENLASIAEHQQSSNMKRYFEIEELKKENSELKDKLKPENCLRYLAKGGYVEFFLRKCKRTRPTYRSKETA